MTKRERAVVNIFNQTEGANMKKAFIAVAIVALLGGCENDARVASHNLSKAADMFEIQRRIVFYNGITGEYMLNIEGRCSIGSASETKAVAITCKTGADQYKKHFLGLSDNVTYMAEQVDAANVSVYHYRVIFKPQTIVPNVDFEGSAKALRDLAK